jgi:hypothetical protein
VNDPRLNKNDEIRVTFYQLGRYISSNETVWRIFGFSVHKRTPAVIKKTFHLENAQHVFFTNDTAIEHALNTPKTTFTELFELCHIADTFCA